MTKFILIINCFILLSITAIGQTKNQLVGKWVVFDVEFDKKDSLTDMFNMTFGKILYRGASYYLDENKIYKFNITDLVEEGNWEFDKSTLRIKFTSDKGTVVKKGSITYVDVNSLKNDTLILRSDSIRLMLKKQIH